VIIRVVGVRGGLTGCRAVLLAVCVCTAGGLCVVVCWWAVMVVQVDRVQCGFCVGSYGVGLLARRGVPVWSPMRVFGCCWPSREGGVVGLVGCVC